MKYILLCSLALLFNCSNKTKTEGQVSVHKEKENLMALIDEIWKTEQEPIRYRDTLISRYGAESDSVVKQQLIIKKNHMINEKKIAKILEKHG